ncbi:MAG: hypothetical protein ACLSVD_13830 [Eggerthellaceae bacterium]
MLADAVSKPPRRRHTDGAVTAAVRSTRTRRACGLPRPAGRALRAPAVRNHQPRPTPRRPSPLGRSDGRRIQLYSTRSLPHHLRSSRCWNAVRPRDDAGATAGAHRAGARPAGGYRQLGRAYMLVGDMDSARPCWRRPDAAAQPNDVAIAYHQLAYALWKAGRPRGCGLPQVGHDVARDGAAGRPSSRSGRRARHGADRRDVVDDELRSAGIVLARRRRCSDPGRGCRGLWTPVVPVARNLLSRACTTARTTLW